MPQALSRPTIKIVFLLAPQMLTTSLSLPAEMLKAAEAAARLHTPKAPKLMIQTLALNSEPVTTQAGFAITPDITLAQVQNQHSEKFDFIYLPALWRNPKPVIAKHAELLPWLQQQHLLGSNIAAVGTGCCFMAQAGLLDGKPATTHWHYFDQFQRLYPKIELKRQHFITQAGNLYSAASVNALADLTVHFIQRLFGRDIAQHVERHFFHEIRSTYESGRVFSDASEQHPDEDIIQAQLWLQDNLQLDIHIQSLGKNFGMSSRNFSRRFKAATGQTPLEYLQKKRISLAKDLLQNTNLGLSEIADKVGYSDLGHFNRLFKRHLSTSPSEYRTTVRSKIFALQ